MMDIYPQAWRLQHAQKLIRDGYPTWAVDPKPGCQVSMFRFSTKAFQSSLAEISFDTINDAVEWVERLIEVSGFACCVGDVNGYTAVNLHKADQRVSVYIVPFIYKDTTPPTLRIDMERFVTDTFYAD